MKSPFPGMDPYLERHWSNVHLTMVSAIQRQLQSHMPDGLRVRAEEAVVLEDGSGSQFRPDVTVVDRQSQVSTLIAPRTGGNTALMPSFNVHLQHDTHYERWVQIVDTRDSRRVITVIEVLSPSNKGPGRGNEAYLQKLDSYEKAGVSLVEIDLLRWPSRSRLIVSHIDAPAGSPKTTPYLACVRRAAKPTTWEVFPLPLRQRLGCIPIPLRATDPEVPLDLQELIDAAYVEGGYGADIDYSKPPDPPLDHDDASWAKDMLQQSAKTR